MKRNYNYWLRILREVEKKREATGLWFLRWDADRPGTYIPEITAAEEYEHVKMMENAGLIKGRIEGITNKGYDFIDDFIPLPT